MKKNVLFTHSYFLRFDPKQWATGQPYAPVGTLYAAALLREHQYTVSLFDTMFAHRPEEVIPVLEQIQPGIFVIYDDGFNYLTKMCLTNMREAAFEMIGYAKQRGCTVIVSGSDATDHFQKYLDKGADFIIIGEAELTLLELANAIHEQKDTSAINGIVYKKDHHPVKTNARKVLKELDSLPLPAWDLVNIENYRQTWMRQHGYFSINIATTRGCPFKCNWCAKPIYGNRYNSRSPRHVIDEIKMLGEKFHFDHIWFCDDIFGLKPGWLHEFSNLVEQEKLSFRFKIQARADLLLQENFIRDLARAGCETIWMGAESGSQQILDAMDKGTTIEQIHQSSALIRKHGMKPCFFIQFGYPGETKQDIRKTIRMINQLLPDEMGVSVSYPLPGTLFFEKVKAELQQKTNWTDSDDLALLFHNTYQPAFYKQLHRYVHINYRAHLAWHTIKLLLRKPASATAHTVKKAASLFYYIPAGIWAKLKLISLQKTPTV